MKIGGNSRDAFTVEHEGKVAKFWGELSGDMKTDYFAAIASSMEWLGSDEYMPVTPEERLSLCMR